MANLAGEQPSAEWLAEAKARPFRVGYSLHAHIWYCYAVGDEDMTRLYSSRDYGRVLAYATRRNEKENGE